MDDEYVRFELRVPVRLFTRMVRAANATKLPVSEWIISKLKDLPPEPDQH